MHLYIYISTHIYGRAIVQGVIQPGNYFSMNACIRGDLSGPLLHGLLQREERLNGCEISVHMYANADNIRVEKFCFSQ